MTTEIIVIYIILFVNLLLSAIYTYMMSSELKYTKKQLENSQNNHGMTIQQLRNSEEQSNQLAKDIYRMTDLTGDMFYYTVSSHDNYVAVCCNVAKYLSPNEHYTITVCDFDSRKDPKGTFLKAALLVDMLNKDFTVDEYNRVIIDNETDDEDDANQSKS